MFQCAAGKDRTGLVAAMVLEAARRRRARSSSSRLREDRGWSLDLLVARFAARMPPGRDAARDRASSTAEASTMQQALDWLHEHHGGAERYLLADGMPPESIATCAPRVDAG